MPAPDVVFALTGDVRRNSRALRQLRTLAAEGLSVLILTLGPPAHQPSLSKGLSLHVLPSPAGRGPLFFGRVHRLFRQAAREFPAQVYHASDLYTLPALHAAARAHAGRLAYDARELYAHVAATTGRPWIRLFWQSVERRYIRRADAVFTVSPSIAQALQQTYRITPPIVLYNAPPAQSLAPSGVLRERLGLSADTAIVLHQGQLRSHRGVTRLVEAFRHVPGGVLVFLGDGPLKPALRQSALHPELAGRVHFLDPVPPDALLPVTASADIGVTLLEDVCLNHRYALPNKLFEYLRAGVPVLGSDLPEVRRVVMDYDVGRVVDPADEAALADTLRYMVDHSEDRARWARNAPAVFDTYSWEQSAARFVRTYQNLTASQEV